jgi:hypothetical protein
MQTVTVVVPRDPASCWKRFTDASLLLAWVPGLRRAQVIAKSRGLPEEVHFEFSDSLAYTLVYAYDVDAHEVRWEPKLGKRDGVAGFARFDATDGGTQVTYGLEQGTGRSEQDRALGDIKHIVDAFAAWMTARS